MTTAVDPPPPQLERAVLEMPRRRPRGLVRSCVACVACDAPRDPWWSHALALARLDALFFAIGAAVAALLFFAAGATSTVLWRARQLVVPEHVEPDGSPTEGSR